MFQTAAVNSRKLIVQADFLRKKRELFYINVWNSEKVFRLLAERSKQNGGAAQNQAQKLNVPLRKLNDKTNRAVFAAAVVVCFYYDEK